ncbi:hypothetical protein M1M11_31485 [Pseudomonas azerbaijanoccidens]|uniref:hypothetical protein n=1 Tax=Pseudomonas azerbaijanoccidentalis TaxID=2842347 RepID=UPI00200A750E|nr:hypothetical protein [Pseudomonas azerbaijanoccidentalis]MCK8669409.1 hypothetical protein [Pseudomonas azerbaijanoccidentalis]
MAEQKHTPGPWFSPDGKTIKQDYRSIGLSESAGCMIGAVMGGPTSGPTFIEVAEEVEANTRLIAAAPELLQALQNLEVAMNTVNYVWEKRPENMWKAMQRVDEDLKSAREAIAKATQ